MGNVSLTILDNLDTLIIMEQWDDLESMLLYLKGNPDLFEQNTIVQVFEFTIRSLGGLISAHLLLTDVVNRPKVPQRYSRFKQICDNYDGFLLEMAYDLGRKLIPTYKTKTHIPVPRVNLAKGPKPVPPFLQKDACTSGAATPVLEFSLLSLLTGDPQFKKYSQLTFWKLWSSRLNFNLMPMTLDPVANQWKDALTGIGASIDSFYEYAAKASIIFNDDYMWAVFKASYKSLLIHLAQGGGPNDGEMIFRNVGTNDGVVFGNWIDLLGAFWPGLQVLTGQLKDAIKTHMVYLKIWDHFDLIPERWRFDMKGNKNATVTDIIALEWYPLRPEFIESTYYLFRATRDPMYLQIGERIVHLLKKKFMAPCGFSGIQDIRTGERQDRMETFVMGETLKYLYLLFDTNDEIFLHNDLMKHKNWVFSTEAHPLWYHKKLSPLKEFISQDDDSASFKTSFFQKCISALDILDCDQDHEKGEKAGQGFYQNITLPQVKSIDMKGASHLSKINPYETRFDQCEPNPFKSGQYDFLSSGYYKWDQVFDADHVFIDSLKRPDYLLDQHLDGSYIELTPEFYKTFTMFPPGKELYLQCPIQPTSYLQEIIVGNLQQINEVEISELILRDQNADHSNKSVLQGDIWIPRFTSLRVSFEGITAGDVDTNNNRVTQEYIDELVLEIDDSSIDMQKVSNNTMLRIHKVNGVHIPQGLVVWTLPFKHGEVNVTSTGRVIIDGYVVENFIEWYG
jgi:alpha-mannosidase